MCPWWLVDSPVSEMFGNVVCDMFGIYADAEEGPGLECVHPVQAEKVQALDGGHAAVLDRFSARVKARGVQPVVVKGVPVAQITLVIPASRSDTVGR